ncbi:MAG TPA: hypothetical protein VIL65_16435 [Beijerinckiaceae bacterium]|jgi:hypothetical protein
MTSTSTAERVQNPADADRLVAATLAVMDDLGAVLSREAEAIRVGRLKEGLAEEARKAELATAYFVAIERVKANAVALARFAPAGIKSLKAAHERFGAAVAANQTVLATARAVSEGLVRSISEELAKAERPQTYAPAGSAGRPAAGGPLLVSRSL